MSIITSTDKQKIRDGWSKGLTKASFGGGKGTCQLTGSKEGFVVLYVYEDKKSLAMDFRDDATPYLFSLTAYKGLKKELDAEFPEASSLRESHLKKPVAKKPGKRIGRESNQTN